jgi:hypothetical protein
MMLSSGMEEMISNLILNLNMNRPAEELLVLTRSTSEMVAAAKFADKFLKRAQYFGRTAYENDDHFLFTLSFTAVDGEEPAELWIANIHDATPDTLSYFRDGNDAAHHVAWPDENGLYMVVRYSVWKEAWYPEDSAPRTASPFYRPKDVVAALRFEVGRLDVASSPKVSVWEHLRRNVSISVKERR